jgi:DNA modification methylase
VDRLGPYDLDHVHCVDVLEGLRGLPDESVRCVVTSPPYWGLRDYGLPASVWGGDEKCEHEWCEEIFGGEGYSSGNRKRWQHKQNRADNPEQWQAETGQGQYCQLCGAWRGTLGLEPTPELYVEHMVMVFEEVRRVLRLDGVLFLNLGDSYAGSNKGIGADPDPKWPGARNDDSKQKTDWDKVGLKPKDLVGIPWRVAFALQGTGWWLRQDIIWIKPNPMPESVTDRCTKSHEYVFLLTKSARYFWNGDAIREPAQDWGLRDRTNFRDGTTDPLLKHHGLTSGNFAERGRNARSVWTIPTQPFPGAHFAVFPEELALRCVKAGSKEGDAVLDPFAGSGTVGVVSLKAQRRFIGFDLSEKYVNEIAEPRLDAIRRQEVLALETT